VCALLSDAIAAAADDDDDDNDDDGDGDGDVDHQLVMVRTTTTVLTALGHYYDVFELYHGIYVTTLCNSLSQVGVWCFCVNEAGLTLATDAPLLAACCYNARNTFCG
jgi:hypothetical protein